MSKRMWTCVVACASCATTPKPVTQGLSPGTVLVEAMIVEVPPAQALALAGKDAKQIAALPGVEVMTQPSMILLDHVEGTATIGCVPTSICENYKLAVTPEILPNETVRLAISVSGDVYAKTSALLRDAQSVVIETTKPLVAKVLDGRMFVIVRSDILHNIGDLRRLRPVTD